MAGKQFKTSLVISGDSRGAVTAVRATHDELGKLARQQASAERGAGRYGASVAAVAREHAGLASEIDAGTGSLRVWSGVAAGAGVAAATAMAVAQARSAKETQIMADALGMSAEQMSEFAYVAKDQGLEASQSMDLLKDIAEKVGDALKFDGGEGKEALKELGLSAEELVKKSPVEMLMDIAAALEEFDSTAEKSAALEMFGNDLTRLLPLLDNGAEKYRAMAQQGRDLNVVLSDADISGMAEMADAFERLSDAGTGQLNQLMADLAPVVSGSADLLAENLDKVGYGVVALSGLVAGRMVSSLMAAVAAQQAAKVAAAQQAAADLASAKAADVKAQSALRVAKSEQAAAQRALANAQAMTVANQASYARKKALDALASANARVAASEKAVAASSLELSGKASVAGRAGKGLTAALGQFGGPWGLAVVAGISAITFAMNAQAEQAKAAADELQRVTALADSARAKAAEPASMQANLAAEQQALSQLQSQVAETERSMARIRKQLDAGGLPTATVVALSETYSTLQTAVAGADDQIKDHQAEIARLKSGLQAAGVEVEGATGQTAGQSKAVRELIEKLQQEELQLKLGERAMLEHQLAQQSATDTEVIAALAAYDSAEALRQKAAADKAAAAETERAAKAYQSWLEQVRDAVDPARKLSEEIEKVNAAVASGDLSEAQGQAYIKNLKAGFKKSAEAGESEFNQMAGRVAQTLQDTIAAGDWQGVGVSVGAVMAGEIGAAVSKEMAASLEDQLGAQMAGIAGAFGGAVVGGLLTYLLTDPGTELKDDSEWRQAQQGTGTVLGDIAAQSESIANATDITAGATEDLVGINRDMLRALQSVQAGISGASTLIARDAGNVQFAEFDAPESRFVEVLGSLPGIFGSAMSHLFGGSSKVTDSGIQLAGGSFSDLMQGVDLQAYQDTKYKKWKYGSTYRRTDYADVSGSVEDQFTAVFNSIADSVSAGAVAVGLAGDDVARAIAEYEVSFTEVSLKGLNAEEQQAQIRAVFSTIFDRLASDVVPFLSDFQLAGEGVGETLARVATQVRVVDEASYRLGFNAEHKTAEQFAYLSDELIKAAGGIDQFISGMSGFVDTFAPDAHKLDLLSADLSRALADVGLEVPASRDAMWDLMQTLDAGTESGRAQIATLLELTDLADQYYAAQLESAKSVEEAALDLLGVQESLKASLSGGVSFFDLKSGLERSLLDAMPDLPDIPAARYGWTRWNGPEGGGRKYGVRNQHEIDSAKRNRDLILAATVDLSLSASRDQFLSLVDAIDVTTDAGRNQMLALEGLGPQLDAYYTAIEQRERQRFDLQTELMRLQGDEAAVLIREREAELASLDPALRGLMRSIYDQQDALQLQSDLAGAQQSVFAALGSEESFDELSARLQSGLESAMPDLPDFEFDSAKKWVRDGWSFKQVLKRTWSEQVSDWQSEVAAVQSVTADLSLVATRDQFLSLVEAIDVATEAGRNQMLALEALAPELDAYYTALEQAFESDMSGYFGSVSDYIQSESAAIEASYQNQIELLREQSRVAGELRDYTQQLRLSDLSPYDPGEKLQLASEQFAALLVRAEAGDLDAAGRLQSAADAYLNNADSYYGRTDAYTSVFDDVVASLDSLGLGLAAGSSESVIDGLNQQMLAEQQALTDYAQQELSWAVAQYESLNSIDQLLAMLPENITAALSPAESDAVVVPVRPDGSHKTGLSRVPWDGYIAELHKGERVLTASEAQAYSGSSASVGVEPLVAELQQLRAEVSALRAQHGAASDRAERQRTGQQRSLDQVARQSRKPVEVV